jgi:hypothetical protein
MVTARSLDGTHLWELAGHLLPLGLVPESQRNGGAPLDTEHQVQNHHSQRPEVGLEVIWLLLELFG